MFDVGFTEILMIGVVALVVIGPERLPAVAKTAGQWIGKLQRFVRGVKTDLASELQSGDLKKLIGDQREQINELKNMVNSAKKDFETNSRDIVQGAKKSLGELESSLKEPDDAASGQANTATITAKAGSSPAAVEVKSDTSSSSSSESAAPPPASTDGDRDTSTMRTDSSGSLDDSAERNRTGTESGS